jgi:hypothetical protein
MSEEFNLSSCLKTELYKINTQILDERAKAHALTTFNTLERSFKEFIKRLKEEITNFEIHLKEEGDTYEDTLIRPTGIFDIIDRLAGDELK